METIIREWEEFDLGTNERPAGRLHATLNPRGLLLMNRFLFDKIGRPERAKLLFDRRNNSIGLRAASPDDKRAYRLKAHKGTHRELWANNFLKYYDILPTQTIRFTDPEIDEDGILILDLNKVQPLVRARRKKVESEEG